MLLTESLIVDKRLYNDGVDEGTLAGRLRELRTAQRLGVTKLARLSGVSRDHIYRIERGERTGVGAGVLASLAQALNTTVDYLIGETGNPDVPDEPHYPVPEPDIAGLVQRLNRLPAGERQRLRDAFEPILTFVEETTTMGAKRTEPVHDDLIVIDDAQTRDATVRSLVQALPKEDQRALLADLLELFKGATPGSSGESREMDANGPSTERRI